MPGYEARYLVESVGHGYITRGSSPVAPKFVKRAASATTWSTFAKAQIAMNSYRKHCHIPQVVQGLRVVTYEYAMEIPQYPGG